jgi:hypothetical protein
MNTKNCVALYALPSDNSAVVPGSSSSSVRVEIGADVVTLVTVVPGLSHESGKSTISRGLVPAILPDAGLACRVDEILREQKLPEAASTSNLVVAARSSCR